MKTTTPVNKTLAELIEKKRAADGYDPEFEATLARIWLCPHCQHRTTILKVLIPVGNPDRDMACPRCGCEGIEPIDNAPEISVIAGGKK